MCEDGQHDQEQEHDTGDPEGRDIDQIGRDCQSGNQQQQADSEGRGRHSVKDLGDHSILH